MSDLFADIFGQDLNIDGVQLVDIDMDGIDRSAQDDAIALIENLSRFYYDEDFMKRQPSFKKRVDADLESLRILFKMRKADEITHDLLMKAISANSNNASLYRSLTDIQKTIISITAKINDIIDGLNAFMKTYQLELNFEEPKEEDIENTEVEDSQDVSTTRGFKDFINKMKDRTEKKETE